MNERYEAPLRDDERARLLAFVDEPMPAGFADRVMSAWSEERAVTPAVEPTFTLADVVPLWRRRSVRTVVAAIVSLAAVVLVALWSRAAVVERDEARERAARLAGPFIEPPPALVRMRVDAHALLAENCSPCHDSTALDAETDALEVFDVRERRWWLTMSDRQLRVVIDRMASRDGMSDDEVAGITSYIAAELDFRSEGHT